MLKSSLAAAALMLVMSAASAVTTYDAGSYLVEYDEMTSFGSIAGSFSSSNDSVGFSWTVPDTATVVTFGGVVIKDFALPSFKLTPKTGYTLGGPIRVFLGNLAFTEIGNALSTAKVEGMVSVDGDSPLFMASRLDRKITSSSRNHSSGYLYLDESYDIDAFSSLEVTDALIQLEASDGTFGQIIAQPQNKLEISFTTPAVPEPEITAMLLAGLASMGWMVRRRRNNA